MKYIYPYQYDNYQEYLWDEYKDYIERTPMTPYERRLLRNWVKAGNSVYENAGSKYYCGCTYPMEYLEVYREDRALDRELRGKTPAEREACLKDMFGYKEEPVEEKEYRESLEKTSESVKERIRMLNREIFHVWAFIMEEGLYSEAMEYVNEHRDEEVPFELF